MTGLESPLLLPAPRRLVLTGGTAARPAWLDAAVESLWRSVCGVGAATREAMGLVVDDGAVAPVSANVGGTGSYRLVIRRDSGGEASVLIHAAPGAAVRSAAATLRQLLRQYTGELPCLEIEDWPGFATRGVMLDVSRDKVPTMDQLRASVDQFAELKFNHLQLYTEHTFAYAGHEEAWREWSPMPPTEVRELDGYCRDRGIELAANQNCFGHLASWLRLPKYAHLAEIEGDAEWRFMEFPRRGPFSLCPVLPESEEFVRGLLGQLLPCFSSRLVNIGCDETFDVGWGRSRAEVAKRGRAAVYWEFVRKITAIARGHGKRPMMWADIALTDPDSLAMMPSGMIGLAWGYEPDARFGAWCEALQNAPAEVESGVSSQKGRECWVCPGTSSWRSITGRTSERRANIAAAAVQGAANGASGFLITDWGDTGHHQHWPVAMMGIAHAAQAAWNPELAAEFDPRAASLHVLDDPSMTLGPWLEELGDVDLELRCSGRVPWMNAPGIRNASALFTDMHPPLPSPAGWNAEQGGRAVRAPIAQWEAVAARLSELAERSIGSRGELITSEIDHTMEYASFMAAHAMAWRRRGDSGPDRVERRRLREDCTAVLEEHRRLWLLRNRPDGLSHSCSFFERVLAGLDEGGWHDHPPDIDAAAGRWLHDRDKH